MASFRDLTHTISPDWRKGALTIGYFLLLGLVNALFGVEFPFRILAWPLYLFPKVTFLAAVMEMLFAYAVACVVDHLLLSKPAQKALPARTQRTKTVQKKS
jgi:hypothetical protein